jgi:hypothetical protein
MTQIIQRKFAKFAHLRYSRFKMDNLSSDFATAIVRQPIIKTASGGMLYHQKFQMTVLLGW